MPDNYCLTCMDAIRQKESVRQKHIFIYSTLVLLSIATVIIPLLFQTTSDAIIPAVFALRWYTTCSAYWGGGQVY